MTSGGSGLIGDLMAAPSLKTTLMLALLALGLVALMACERGESPTASNSASPGAQNPPPMQAPVQAPVTPPIAPPVDNVPVVLCLGDSLTAGFGLPQEQSFPSLLQNRLAAEGYPHRVVNAGVSGDTSAGGLARLDWLLRQRVDVLVLALGANDGLRGQSAEAMAGNLSRIIERVKARGIRVLLGGMRMPANYGAEYQRGFAAVFPTLARKHDVALLPFLLEGVAGDPSLNQADGIHPNAKGAKIVADTVWNALKPLL